MDVLILALVVLVSMGARDCLGTISTACIVHGHKLLAGAFDGLCDIAAVVSIGGSAAATLEHGLSLATLAVLLSLFCGSMLGTYGGMVISGHLEVRFGRTVPHPLAVPVVAEA